MPDDLRIRELVEEALESGLSPEAVCLNDPDLLHHVRERWERFHKVEAALDDIFPRHDETPDQVGTTRTWPGDDLPEIAGYEVQSVLGSGGMGVVYRARHEKLNRTVAIKMMRSGDLATAAERARFAREAEAVASLRHPNIVQVFDVGDWAGLPFFTMEFFEGGSLAQLLQGAPWPARRAVELMATLAGAVEHAHQRGIVHRDLKPANILLLADGTAKVGDFGLARRFEAGPSITMSGARVGTPSYMAPEQALGTSAAVRPAVDVYALGALLYETLTGRPPFRGVTAAETERQVVADEPVPPSRLNSKVPRDLETICLKCLHKNPARRYPSASELERDLLRFARGEPILARPAGPVERAGKWVRRRPELASLLGASLLLAMILGGGGARLLLDREATLRVVREDLREVVRHQRRSSWPESGSALQRAKIRLGNGGNAEVAALLERAERDQRSALALEGARFKNATRLRVDGARLEAEYEAAFRGSVLGEIGGDPGLAAARIRASEIRQALVDGLDDWAIFAAYRPDRGRLAWLLEVAREADPDPTGWRDRFRDPRVWRDLAALKKLSDEADLAQLSVPLVLALGDRIRSVKEDWIALLEKAVRQHPDDLLINTFLARTLDEVGNPTEAIRYYQAAVALRPDVNWVHQNIGVCQMSLGRLDEAIASYREAIRLAPEDGRAYPYLGYVLAQTGRTQEAFALFQKAMSMPDAGPESANWWRALAIRAGRTEEIRRGWRKQLDDRPFVLDACDGYAEFCLFLGDRDEYRRARRILLGNVKAEGEPRDAERVGRACLLLPGSDEEMKRASALVDFAVESGRKSGEWTYWYFLFARALADYRAGRFDEAAAILKGRTSEVLVPGPLLLLAMTQHRLGHKDEALATLAATTSAFDWRPTQARDREAWIFHALRREAEALILPDLPALLAGDLRPRSPQESRALIGSCLARDLVGAASRLRAQEVEADPRAFADVVSGGLYPSARLAALAGCGGGADADGLTEAERRGRRDQALRWLRADLASWTSRVIVGDPDVRRVAREQLTPWLSEADLYLVRDERALAGLSAGERQAWQDLWRDLKSLIHRAATTP